MNCIPIVSIDSIGYLKVSPFIEMQLSGRSKGASIVISDTCYKRHLFINVCIKLSVVSKLVLLLGSLVSNRQFQCKNILTCHSLHLFMKPNENLL